MQQLFLRLARRLPIRKKPKLRRRCRLQIEQLEERLTPAQVLWNIDASGFWDVGTNWSTGVVPGSADDVIIDRPAGNFTVTHRAGQGDHSVRSILSNEALTLSGATL